MSSHLILEVISGPMDGLKSTISGRQAGIGRGVGNTLTLPLDMYVSRSHASIVLEGHDWCLRQTGGKTGTWISGKKLEPDVSYPLSTGQVILMGTTVIHVRVSEAAEPHIVLTDDCFSSLFSQFEITADLAEILHPLTKNSPQQYVGIEDILNAAMALTYDGQRYRCITDIASENNIQCLGRWLLDFFPCASNYKIDENALLTTPRLLTVMMMASQGKKRSVDLTAFIDAVIKEDGSLSARYFHKDQNFMEDYPELESYADHRIEENITLNDGTDDTGAIQITDVEKLVVSNFETETIDLMPNDTEVLLRSLCDFETLVLGFLEDAAGRRTSDSDFFLPGYTKKLKAIYADGHKKETDAYIDDLYRILVGILAAQRDATREVETEIHNRIKKALNRFNDKKGNRIFKKVHSDAVSDMVLSVIKETELEQLAEGIIRANIKQLFDPPARAKKAVKAVEHQ